MSRKSGIWPRKGRGYWTWIGRQQKFLAHNRKDARKELDRLLKQDKPTHVGQFTVAQLVAMFLADCNRRVEREELSPRSLTTIRSYMTRWADACRRVKPEYLRVYHLDAWVESHDGWNSTTRAAAIGHVKFWSRWVKRKGYLDTNHLADAVAPERKTRAAADPADLLRLEVAIGDDRFRDWFHVLYDTGCRPGELRRITAADVNSATSTAMVIGKRGERVVGLTKRSLRILERLAELYPDGPLLRTLTGCEWQRESVRYHWAKWCEVIWPNGKRPKEMTPYAARHDLWQRWHEAGISDIIISRQLGHKKYGRPHIGLLLSTYAHADAASLGDAARKASSQASKSRNRG